MWGWGRRCTLKHPLDRALLKWCEYDPFRVRDLLSGGLLDLGRSGAGKTSSSGRVIGQAIVSHAGSAGLVLLPKPEDIGMWQAIFRKAGRLRDLIVFAADGPWRCNFLHCLGRDPRTVAQFISTQAEVLKRGDSQGSGGESSRFYEQQENRTHYNIAAALHVAGETISGPAMQRFLMTAAGSPEEVGRPEWQDKYQGQVLLKGHQARKTPLQARDYELVRDFWLFEWPGMDPKTRSNIVAGVMGTLHVFNVGLVREMVSGQTNCSPEDILAGKWVLVNFPPSSWGDAGLFISAGWKALAQLAILKRKAAAHSPFCVIWADEAHQFVTGSQDSTYIAQCRSHMGALVYLSQSVSSFYAAMKGENGRHQADALLANFSHVIVHACDPMTAKWASAKLGRCKEILYSGNSSAAPDSTVWDMMYGRQHVSSGFSEQYQEVLQDGVFMNGLRTGGPANRYLCDGILLRNAEPFADGRNYKFVTFSQRG